MSEGLSGTGIWDESNQIIGHHNISSNAEYVILILWRYFRKI